MAGAVHTEAYRACLAELIRLRHEARLSQAELARLLGKPPSFVGKYELGERRLDLVEALVVLKALGGDPRAFLDELAGRIPDRLG